MPPARTPVKVVLADDHPMYREGLARAIRESPELELVAEVASGREALERIRELDPDVAVLDMRMPGLEGTQVLRALRRDGFDTRVLFLSANTDSELAYRAIADGAKGYLAKSADREEICAAIRTVARGEPALAPEVQSGLVSEIANRADLDSGPRLTDREEEVLTLVADGLSAPEIGKQIHLSTATVKGHLQTLYNKLDVSDRAAAVAEGMRRGLLE